MPKVSVILPVYNRIDYIGESIRSVLAQTFDSLELIIIDDGSTDGTLDEIEKFRAIDGRVKVIKMPSNMGVSSARNAGIEIARGEYIALLDSDDVWKQDKLERQMEVVNSDPDAVVWSECLIMDNNGKANGLTFTDYVRSAKLAKSGDIFQDLIKCSYMCTITLLFRKNALRGGRFDEGLSLAEDYKFAIFLASENRFQYIEEPLAFYRVYEGNSYHGIPGKLLSSEISVLKYAASEFREKITMSVLLHRIALLFVHSLVLPVGLRRLSFMKDIFQIFLIYLKQ